MAKIRAAIVGLGYWGPNLARNLQISEEFELVALCDAAEGRLAKVGQNFPWAARFTDFSAMLSQAQPELVVVATPVGSHHGLATQALQAGAHVLCEKPLAATVEEAASLIETATRCNRQLFVDHTFVYTGAVRKVRELYSSGRLGQLFYVDSVRVNLGLFQPDVDVIWDLAPHDLSIFGYVLGRRALSVQARGSSHNPRGFADVAHVSVEYEDGLTAHMHLSWLSPVKIRRMIWPGTQSSLIYDDIEPSEKIKIYDHGVNFDVADLETRKQVQVSYRRGDVWVPALDSQEALAVELREVATAIRGGAAPAGTHEQGFQVIRILDAMSRSLRQGGQSVAVGG